MPKLSVYDPPMCCSSGVCGPQVDPSLIRFAENLERLRREGVEIERYNLSQEIWAFVQNPTVKGTLGRKGVGCLPLILVDGKVVSEARYPRFKDLAEFVGLDSHLFEAVAKG